MPTADTPPADKSQEALFTSLSFRFDTPGRSIVYTGDTGPSSAVEELASGADLLVSEMIDVERILQQMGVKPGQSPVEKTLRRFHLAPEQVGELARNAGVKSVVITHLIAPGAEGADQIGYLRRIGTAFQGPAVIASDLERF